MKKAWNYFLNKIGYPRGQAEYIKIKKAEYDLMKKMVERQDNFSTQIIKQTKEIDFLKTQLEKKEIERKHYSGKCGGLTKQVNKLTKKINLLLNENDRLSKIIDKMGEETSVKNLEIEMLKNKGKRKKDVESYKNYFQARKELEKREKNE